jgi:hypothetical protein
MEVKHTFDINQRVPGNVSLAQPRCFFRPRYLFEYRRATVFTDSVSAVSVIRGLPRPEKNIGKLTLSVPN